MKQAGWKQKREEDTFDKKAGRRGRLFSKLGGSGCGVAPGRGVWNTDVPNRGVQAKITIGDGADG